MKKGRKGLLIFLCVFLLIVGIIGGIVVILNNNRENEIKIDADKYYSKAVKYLEENDDNVEKNKEDYQLFIKYDGFNVAKEDNYIVAYMWILEQSYYVDNNELVEGTGSSMFYKFIFDNDKVKEYKLPEDGEEYASSIRKMCSDDSLANKVINYVPSFDIESEVNNHYSYLNEKEEQSSSNDKVTSSNSNEKEGQSSSNDKVTSSNPKEESDNKNTQTTPIEPVKTCTAKKFNKKYTYVYSDEKTCLHEGNNAFYEVTDNNKVSDEIFTFSCEKIIDDCGNTYYGVYFNAFASDGSVYVVNY